MKSKYIGLLVVLVVLLIIGGSLWKGMVGYNDSGHMQIKQSFPRGKMSVISNAGVFWRGFSKMDIYKISETFYFSKSGLDGGKGLESDPITVRFAGGGKADIDGSIRFRLPAKMESRLLLHKDFRSYEAVVSDLIRQYASEALKNTATLMKPEDTYSGRKGEFNKVFQEQLERGIFQTKSKQVIVEDAEGNKLTDTIVEIMMDSNNKPIIDKVSPFITYNITLTAVSIKDIDYDPTIDALILSKQKAEQAKVVARAEAEQSKQDAITEEQKGLAEVAKARALEEVEKIKEVTQAQKSFEVAQWAKKEAKEKADAEIIKKEAEAKANALLVRAGLTPIQKATIDKETKIGVARELAKANMPSIVIGGSDKNGASPLDAVGIKFLMDINDKLSKQK